MSHEWRLTSLYVQNHKFVGRNIKLDGRTVGHVLKLQLLDNQFEIFDNLNLEPLRPLRWDLQSFLQINRREHRYLDLFRHNQFHVSRI